MRRVVFVLAIAACGGGDDEIAPDGPAVDAPPGDPTAAELLDKIATCDDVVGGTFAPESGEPSTINICGYPGALAWKADLSVDCDGKMTDQCSLMTDPAYQDQTAATDSHGDPLDAAALPYVVIPGRGTRFDYTAAGLSMGSVVAVIYQGTVEYGVLGDVGPVAIIGEASYRMAALLGIDPDPATGGIESGVAYIAFPGADGEVQTIEDHDQAIAVGITRAKQLLGR